MFGFALFHRDICCSQQSSSETRCVVHQQYFLVWFGQLAFVSRPRVNSIRHTQQRPHTHTHTPNYLSLYSALDAGGIDLFTPSIRSVCAFSDTQSMTIRVFFILSLLLLSSSFLQVARCQADSDTEAAEAADEVGDIGIVGDDVQDYGGGTFSPAPGVETVCVFPKNPSKLVVAGEESELLVGMKNEGDSSVNIIAIQASVHLPYDHSLLIQNLSTQAFNNASVPPSAQATFPYIFTVNKFLQSGTFDIVGTIVYEIEQQPYQSTFYNGTIEVTEAGGLVSVESVFLFSLGIALLVLLGLWIRSQIQNLSKKTKRAPKVEVGTGTTDASMDEWLQGTAYTQSQSSKSKKKK